MHLHIDGDLLKYRCGFAAEHGEYRVTLPDGEVLFFLYKKQMIAALKVRGLVEGDVEVAFSRQLEPVANALHNVRSLIKAICQALNPDDFTVYLSGPDNFRDDVATIRPYKGNRDPAHTPVHGDAIVAYMGEQYTMVMSVAEEADDTIGWSHYAMWKEDDTSSVIVSVDKDLDMIPGLHYNFVEESCYIIDEPYAMYVFYKQMLTGDSTDNIVGIPGIGVKRAEKFLEGIPHDEDQLYKVVKDLYGDAYGPDARDALLEHGQLLWIRRLKDELWLLPDERS